MDARSPIVVGSSEGQKVGDFGIKVTENALEVPENVYQFCRECGIRNAMGFMTVLNTYPSYLAQALGWTLEDVQAASALAETELKMHLPALLFVKKKRETRGGGIPGPGVVIGNLPRTPEDEWMNGVTNASHHFVVDAEKYINGCQDAVIIGLLTDEIRKIKAKKVVLVDWLHVDDFIAQAQ